MPAFNRLSEILSPLGPHPVVEDINSLPLGWKFPTGLAGQTIGAYDTADLDDQIVDSAYFDDPQPFSSNSSFIHHSAHSSTETAGSTRLEPDMRGELSFNLLSKDVPISEDPLDLTRWADMSLRTDDFGSNAQVQHNPLVPHEQRMSTGHHPNGSISESVQTHSSSTKESTVSTPISDGIGLHHIDEAASEMTGESSGQPLDFKWSVSSIRAVSGPLM